MKTLVDDTKPTYCLGEVLGAVIRLEREARGIEQLELGGLSGVSVVHLSRIERSLQKNIGIAALEKIAAGLSSRGMRISASVLLSIAESYLERMGGYSDPAATSVIVAVRQMVADAARQNEAPARIAAARTLEQKRSQS